MPRQRTHPNRGDRLHSLGDGYLDRYERTGLSIDIEVAIRRLQEALDATPEDHLDRGYRIQPLGLAFYNRYARTGSLIDLETAIRRHQEALDAIPKDHPNRGGPLQSLGIFISIDMNKQGHWSI